MQEPLKQEFLKVISIIHRKTQMYMNEQVTPHGLSAGLIPFIMITCEHGKMAQNKLGELLDINKSTVTKMVTKLESQAYLIREINAEDNRSFDVYPTEKAFEIFEELKRIGAQWVDEISKGMTEIEQDIFSQMLRKVAENAGAHFV